MGLSGLIQLYKQETISFPPLLAGREASWQSGWNMGEETRARTVPGPASVPAAQAWKHDSPSRGAGRRGCWVSGSWQPWWCPFGWPLRVQTVAQPPPCSSTYEPSPPSCGLNCPASPQWHLPQNSFHVRAGNRERLDPGMKVGGPRGRGGGGSERSSDLCQASGRV